MRNKAATSTNGMALRMLIVDGHSYAYRAFYAIRQLKSPSGRPTNAIYGFIRMLEKLQECVKPTHMAVVWDGGLNQERKNLVPEYKAQRPEMPVELGEQLDEIVSYLNAVEIVSLVKQDVEADDCIAALTMRAEREGFEIVIASSDKDFMQLVNEKVRIVNLSGKREDWLDKKQVEIKAGVNPSQIVDWLSMTGDAVDNIAGVPGIGPKTAARLLKEFYSIDELLRRVNEIQPARLKESLQNAVDLIRRNQKMIRLKAELDCDVPVEKMKIKARDEKRVRPLLKKWGFRSLLRETEEETMKTGDLFGEKDVICASVKKSA